MDLAPPLPLSQVDFELDVVARVGWAGFVSSNMDGVVFVDNTLSVSSASWVPICTESVASNWPEGLRLRLSGDVIQDKQTDRKSVV